MKLHKLFLIVAFTATVLSGCMSSLSSTSAPPTPVPPPPGLSTPELIVRDFTEGKITEEQETLYLVYALYEQDTLPAQYHGDVSWEGTMLAGDIYMIVNSKEKVCKFSSFTRSELSRILGDIVASCDNKNNSLLIILFFVFCALAVFAIVNGKKILLIFE